MGQSKLRDRRGDHLEKRGSDIKLTRELLRKRSREGQKGIEGWGKKKTRLRMKEVGKAGGSSNERYGR